VPRRVLIQRGNAAQKFFSKVLEPAFFANQIYRIGSHIGADRPETQVFGGVSNPCCFTEDMVMRTELDFTPLFRSSIGFDRLFNLLDNAQRLQAVDLWPPYDIVKLGDDQYEITMAVAGFSQSDLDVTQERNVLIIKGGKAEKKEGEYLHRGISGQSFERRFELADHVHVETASLADGLLRIVLKQEIPEAMKPRRIAIGDGGKTAPPLQIGADKQVA
jgi:molecular chaperone IbpA